MVLPANPKQNFTPPVPHPPGVGVAVAQPFRLALKPPTSNFQTPTPPVPAPLPSTSTPRFDSEKKISIFKKVVLIILDGFGLASAGHGNAVFHAKRPTLDYLAANFPSLTLHASGPLVGLPWGEMGNSEVGHLNIGAGRIVGQDLPRITASIQSGDFFKNQVLLEACMHASRHNSKLHLMGLVSNGGVHSLNEHLYALLGLAEDKGVNRVYIHMFTDGRDTAEKVALEDIKDLRKRIARIGVGEIATVTGRFYAMDRAGHWNQTDLTYKALVDGQGEVAHSAEDCVWRNYQNGIYDEMIKPTVISEIGRDGGSYPVAKIEDNDAVVFFNFRPDRAVQLTQSFVSPQSLPEEFRRPLLKNLYFATMTEYAQNLPVHIAFPHVSLKNNLAELLSERKFAQFHIAESEKYAHVTSFFDCGRSEPYALEERKIVASPDNARNYIDHPEMSAEELTDILVAKITGSQASFYIANYANADMVGHTGSLKSAIKAVEVLDQQLKKVLDACLEAGACLIVTADHGNIEEMIDLRTGDIDKDHTTNPVPFFIAAKELRYSAPRRQDYLSLSAHVPDGAISDIAPTILELLGIEKPAEMTGVSLMETVRNF